jgi:hypothetical protein
MSAGHSRPTSRVPTDFSLRDVCGGPGGPPYRRMEWKRTFTTAVLRVGP